MAEIELGTADGSDEIEVYDEVQDYLASGRYPKTATKFEKGVIRKRAKKFLLVDGVLHYKQSVKGGFSLIYTLFHCVKNRLYLHTETINFSVEIS